MTTVAYLLRAFRRGRWTGYAAVAVLLGLTGGVSLFAIAGARRTESAYPRYLRRVSASTISLDSLAGYAPEVGEQMANLPSVVQSRTSVGFNVDALRSGRPDAREPFEADGTFDGSFFDQDQFTATQGRRADPRRADEIMVNEYAARQFGYHVGERLDLATYSTEQIEVADFFEHPPRPKLETPATIVGIGVLPDEVVQDDSERTPRLLLTPAFSNQARPYATYSEQGLILRHGDADAASVKRRLAQVAPSGTTDVQLTSVDVYHAVQAIRPLAIALGLFGVIIGLAGVVLVTQALSRLIRADRDDRARLRALGASPSTLIGVGLVAPLVTIVVGGLIAVAVAVAASPAMPVGPVRRVAAGSGFDVDATVLLIGALALVVVLGLATVAMVWRELPHRVSQRRAAQPRPSRAVSWASSTRLSPPAVLGLQFASTPATGPSYRCDPSWSEP